MRNFYVLIMLLLLGYLKVQAICLTVWVHGTYPALGTLTASWCPIRKMVYAEPGLSLAKNLPQNYYFRKLAQSLHDYDSACYNLDTIYTYGWHSSNVRPARRITEGKKLYEQVQALLYQYQKKYKHITIRFIGFSHGGNVLLNMAQHLPFIGAKVDVEFVLLGTPIQESTRRFINSPFITKAYSFYSDGDWIQKIDVQKFHHNCPKNAPFLSQRTFQKTDCVHQICLTVNGKKIGHTKYRELLLHLPDMLKQVDALLVKDPKCDQLLCFNYKHVKNLKKDKRRSVCL